MRLGERLHKRGVLTQTQLDTALQLQQKTGSRLGEVVIGQGSANYRALYETIAESKGLPFVDLQATPPDPTLLSSQHIGAYLRLRMIPWRHENGAVTIAVSDMDYETLDWIKKYFGKDTALVITSPLDIRRAVETAFTEQLERRSRLWLWSKKPHASTRVTLLPRQQQIFTVLGILTLTALLFAPRPFALAFIILCHVAYTFTMIFKCVVFAAGVAPNLARQNAVVPEIPDSSLPIYTILILCTKKRRVCLAC